MKNIQKNLIEQWKQNNNSYTYDINDFLLNKNNIFFRVYYFSNIENSNDINNNERYMIITKSTILFFYHQKYNY